MRGAIDVLFWPISFNNQKIWGNVKAVRHALSLDDERRSFYPLRVEPESDKIAESNPGQIKEVWFAGVHSDVGGGYPEDTAARRSFALDVGRIGGDRNRPCFSKGLAQILARRWQRLSPRSRLP